MRTTTIHATPREIANSLHLLDYLAALPSPQLLADLRAYRFATLEVMENRTRATLYRIRQSGRLYLCGDPDDTLTLVKYPQKPLVYTFEKNTLNRVKQPRFEALFDNQLQLSDIVWLDPQPEQPQPYYNKGIQFIKSYDYRRI